MVVEETINDPAFPNPIPDGIYPFLQVGTGRSTTTLSQLPVVMVFNSFPVSQPAEIDEVGRIRIMFFQKLVNPGHPGLVDQSKVHLILSQHIQQLPVDPPFVPDLQRPFPIRRELLQERGQPRQEIVSGSENSLVEVGKLKQERPPLFFRASMALRKAATSASPPQYLLVGNDSWDLGCEYEIWRRVLMSFPHHGPRGNPVKRYY